MLWVLCCALLVVSVQGLTYSRTFQTGSNLPLTDLEDFVRKLPTSGLTKITVSASSGATFTCTGPTAQAIVNGFKTFGTYPNGAQTFSCGGHTWYTGGCCGNSIEIGGPFACACQQSWAIRSGAGCSWGTNWGGTSCPSRGPLTLTIEVPTCNGIIDPGEPCDGGLGCTNCNCDAGYTSYSPSQTSCKLIDMCATYGASGTNPNLVQSCVNGVPNQRTVTCKDGYYVAGRSQTTTSLTLIGPDNFPGCVQINYCSVVGYSGNSANTLSCVPGVGSRTITCMPGYYAVAPDVNLIVLLGTAPFNGCTLINTCSVYGTSGHPEFVKSCVPALNSRTVTCLDGYAIVNTISTSFITLAGNAPFPGCALIDTCKVWGFSGKTDFTVSCVSAINQRTITCQDGYYPEGVEQGKTSITLTGSAVFGGCSLQNQCNVYGYSGNSNFTSDCIPGVNNRTLICLPGYHAEGSTPATKDRVMLVGGAPFLGCTIIDNCLQYGYSGQSNTKSCVNGINTRTITCADGYYVSSTPALTPGFSVTLIGSTAFVGCSVVDNCLVYGYSGRQLNTIKCVTGINTRTITCAAGYYASDGSSQFKTANPSITLTGKEPFMGCADVPECSLYGYSGRSNFTYSCVESAINKRTITCDAGYFAIAPATPNVTLVGNATFTGCFLINNCDVYGFSGLTNSSLKCVNGINTRTLTCKPGYAANLPANNTIVLTGNAKFAGCKDIDECAVYGFKNFPERVTGCVNGPGVNARTVSCGPNYGIKEIGGGGDQKLVESFQSNITLMGSTVFPGCSPWCGDMVKLPVEACDDGNLENGDGCNMDCRIEKGFFCNQEVAGACCPDQDSFLINELGLICLDGSWAPVKENFPVLIDGATKYLNVSVTICGDIVVGRKDDSAKDIGINTPRTPKLVLLPGVTLTIAGTLTLEDTAVISFYPGSLIALTPYCPTRTRATPREQLTVSEAALIYINRTVDSDPNLLLDKNNNHTIPGPFINIANCASLTTFKFWVATEGRFTSGNFPLIHTETVCAWNSGSVIGDVGFSLNVTCPNFSSKHANNTVFIGIDAPALCPAQIAGISVGTIGGVAVVAGGAAAAASGLFTTAAPVTADYVSL